jgi:hypothetical protein
MGRVRSMPMTTTSRRAGLTEKKFCNKVFAKQKKNKYSRHYYFKKICIGSEEDCVI